MITRSSRSSKDFSLQNKALSIGNKNWKYLEKRCRSPRGEKFIKLLWVLIPLSRLTKFRQVELPVLHSRKDFTPRVNLVMLKVLRSKNFCRQLGTWIVCLVFNPISLCLLKQEQVGDHSLSILNKRNIRFGLGQNPLVGNFLFLRPLFRVTCPFVKISWVACNCWLLYFADS